MVLVERRVIAANWDCILDIYSDISDVLNVWVGVDYVIVK
jgi:hypothetical protein